MNKCLESKQSNETCRPLSLDKNTFTWTMIVMISSCFYIAQKLLKSENPYSNNFTCVMCKSPKTAGTLNSHTFQVVILIKNWCSLATGSILNILNWHNKSTARVHSCALPQALAAAVKANGPGGRHFTVNKAVLGSCFGVPNYGLVSFIKFIPS